MKGNFKTYTEKDPIPQEIIKYCLENGYGGKLIPLNVNTVNKIAKILAEKESGD